MKPMLGCGTLATSDHEPPSTGHIQDRPDQQQTGLCTLDSTLKQVFSEDRCIFIQLSSSLGYLEYISPFKTGAQPYMD